jgi:hypothetical protein
MAPEHDPPAFAISSSGEGQLAPSADATPRRRPRKSQARSSRLPRLRLAAAASVLSARWEREPGRPRAWSRMRLRLPAQPASAPARRPWGAAGPDSRPKARGGLAQLAWPQPTPAEKAAAHRHSARAGRGRHWKSRPLAPRRDRRRRQPRTEHRRSRGPQARAQSQTQSAGRGPDLCQWPHRQVLRRTTRCTDVTVAPDLGPPWHRGNLKGNGD